MIVKTQNLRPLGSLEEQVMKILWAHGPMTVRDLGKWIGEKKLAYTTVMTTMDRLFKKGLLSRAKEGLAYVYTAKLGESAYQQSVVEATVAGLISKAGDVSPVLAAFVNAAGELNEEHLATLEALIDARRKEGD